MEEKKGPEEPSFEKRPLPAQTSSGKTCGRGAEEKKKVTLKEQRFDALLDDRTLLKRGIWGKKWEVSKTTLRLVQYRSGEGETNDKEGTGFLLVDKNKRRSIGNKSTILLARNLSA